MKKALFAVVGVMAMAGCGAKQNLYRVAVAPGTAPDTCYPKGVNPSTKTVTLSPTAQIDGGVWEIWSGANDKVYLVGPSTYNAGGQGSSGGGTNVIEGAFKDNAYTFEKTVTETQTDKKDSPNFTQVTVHTDSFSLTVDGDTLDGKWTRKYTSTCNGTGCPTGFKDNDPDCAYDNSVHGVKIEGDNEHQI